jgi:uncharacterized protein with HEPN domain
MSKRNNLLLLIDILEAVNSIEEYLLNMTADDFYMDKKTKDAVVRNIEIIGEASNQITPDYKLMHPDVEWREAADLRNKVIHDYSALDYVLLWEIIHLNIPAFKQKIQLLADKYNSKLN